LLGEHLAMRESGMSDAPTAFPYEQNPAPLLMAAEEHDRYASGAKKRRGKKSRT